MDGSHLPELRHAVALRAAVRLGNRRVGWVHVGAWFPFSQARDRLNASTPA